MVTMKMKIKEIQELNEAMKQTSDKRLYESYLAVRLRLKGLSMTEISDLLGGVRQTIAEWMWICFQIV